MRYNTFLYRLALTEERLAMLQIVPGHLRIKLEIVLSSTEKMPLIFVFMLATISFTNIMNSKDELVSPCLTPKYDIIVGDVWRLCFIVDRTLVYIALKAFVIFELTFSANNFYNFSKEKHGYFYQNIFHNQWKRYIVFDQNLKVLI